jgi:hypothetical protein
MTEQAPGSFLKRLFCLGGRELREHNDPSEWVTSHSQQQVRAVSILISTARSLCFRCRVSVGGRATGAAVERVPRPEIAREYLCRTGPRACSLARPRTSA